MKKTLFIAGVVFTSVLTLSACSGWNDANGHGDAEVKQSDSSGAEVINMPDTFGNLATKCSHGFRVWSTTHGSGNDMQAYASQIWVEKDLTCEGPVIK
jgi:predicted small secreted protein